MASCKSDSVEEIQKILIHFKEMILSDPNLGALLLYFFDPVVTTLSELIKFDNLPLECFVSHIGYKLASAQQDEFERIFMDENLNVKF